MLIPSLRAAITAAGGTPTQFDAIGLLRELVTALGGTPTQFSIIGLLREAVTAKGGTPTQWTIVGLLRELVTALGATPATFDPEALMAQVAANASASAVTLNALILTNSIIQENSAPGTVIGAIQNKTAGSTLTLTDDAGGKVALSGLNIVCGLTNIDYEAATSFAFVIRETLAGATNSPNDNARTITVTNDPADDAAAYVPAFKFNDNRNSQYVAVLGF